ncbi:hypothetical protein AKJ49_01380 [candidate division MSBL1 archaeon SCGC-AAA382A03]|uniref:4Fe-4S ferredoxin-type domain-containing protein n=1 Tax=candidate division MSBL1 archaeon SCGC-AAA382A03 TaxID=1698278 RepID=A0A133VFF1_9EURY|nr:hypothetical protein AKJ49_01380 [candidate division MSBL1 archaeon SCGC-AAA382A03]
MPKIIPDVLKNLFSKPFTLKYPHERKEPPENARGKPIVDREECISCKLCEKICPPKAITLDEDDKPIIDLGICIFCSECADACPKGAIKRSGEYELALYDRSKAISK